MPETTVLLLLMNMETYQSFEQESMFVDYCMVMFEKYIFKPVNVAIQTVLTVYEEMSDAVFDLTHSIPPYQSFCTTA